MDAPAATIGVVGMIDEAMPQPLQMFQPAASLGWVRAEWVMQPLSGLEMTWVG